MQDPLWFRILIALIQAAVGAGSALLAVFLTQRFTLRDQKQRLFGRMFEPYLKASQDTYLQLVELQEAVKRDSAVVTPELRRSCEASLAAIRRSLFWLGDPLNGRVVDFLERLLEDVNAGRTITPETRSMMVDIQRGIRHDLGVSKFFSLVDQLGEVK